jgi:signal transduction histidine kinase/ActR/RegA family two-component response regulator
VRYACITELADGVGRNVAWAGEGAEFFSGSDVDRWRLEDRARQGAITAQALSEAHPVVCNDYLAVAEGVWREAALRHGIASIAVFPFRRGGKVAGALTIFDPETDAFDPELTLLFAGLAGDIGFALDNHDQRQQREQALAEERAGYARFQKLFQSAPLIAVILRLSDRQVVDINDTGCLRLAVPRGEAMGLTLPGIGIGEADARHDAFFDALHRGGQVRNLETTLRTVQGPRAALLSAEVIDYQGERCVLAMGLDIADLRAAEEARRELAVVHAANAAKTDFLSRVSHELRTPMNAVLGFAQLMRSTGAGRLLPSDMDRLDHILQAGTHLLKLIDDVLDVSRIEAGKMHVETTGVPLQALLDQAVGLVLPLAARHGVQVDAAYRQEAPAAVLADETRLRQVVANLLSNAIKYNRPAGRVRLALHVHATSVELLVEDSGLGMTPEQLRQLYEPFNRLGRERGGIEGTGIGLALTRQLVTLMRGTLHIDSTAGVGTRAVVTLPRAPLPGGAQPPADDWVLAPSHQGTVLYIEDNPVNVMLVEAMLDGWPEVRLAGAELGARGIAQARALKPDLVLLDMQLPDMSGLDVIRALRADPETRDLRIVVLSASAMPEEVDQARSAGADDYWTKPLDYAAFLEGVGRMLASAQA